MRIRFDIHESKYFTPESNIGSMAMDSIPTTSMPFLFDTNNVYYLTNTLHLSTYREQMNGEYYVSKSIIYITSNTSNTIIDLFVIKNNESQSPHLYLRGTIMKAVFENYIPVNLGGSIDLIGKALVLPRTSLDFICVDKVYYEHEKVIHNNDGSVFILLKNGISKEQFMETHY